MSTRRLVPGSFRTRSVPFRRRASLPFLHGGVGWSCLCLEFVSRVSLVPILFAGTKSFPRNLPKAGEHWSVIWTTRRLFLPPPACVDPPCGLSVLLSSSGRPVTRLRRVLFRSTLVVFSPPGRHSFPCISLLPLLPGLVGIALAERRRADHCARYLLVPLAKLSWLGNNARAYARCMLAFVRLVLWAEESLRERASFVAFRSSLLLLSESFLA